MNYSEEISLASLRAFLVLPLLIQIYAFLNQLSVRGAGKSPLERDHRGRIAVEPSELLFFRSKHLDGERRVRG